jgi:hypothetical protein
VIEDRALNTTYTSNHQRAHNYPLAQTTHDTAFNPYHYQGDPSNGPQRKLTLGNLQEVDRKIEAASGMTRWIDEVQRNGAWDGVGYARAADGCEEKGSGDE